MGEGDIPRDISRLTVPEAARELGISPEAVRNRLSRGTLNSVKEAGTVYVLLEIDKTRHIDDTPSDISHDTPHMLVEEMRGRIESLERQLEQANERDRENRRIVAMLTSRIPAIEAPQEPSESPETAAETTVRGEGPADPQEPSRDVLGGPRSGTARGSWWRRMFGG